MGLAYDTPFPATPEHDKLKARPAEHDAIVEFLNWIEMHGMEIISDVRNDGWGMEVHQPTDLIARYFEVDRAGFERENQAVLEWARRDPAPKETPA